MEKNLERDSLDPDSNNAEAWNACYRGNDTPWDQGQPSPALVDYLLEHPLHGAIFVPGCGRGHDVRALAASGLQVTGLDVSAEAVGHAEAFDPAGSERYVCGDLFELPASLHGHFDWVWEHTCFCAILPEQRMKWLAALRAVLKPGGRVLGIFFTAPESDVDGPPFKIQIDALRAILETGFTIDSEWCPRRFYPGREGAEVMMVLSRQD